MLSLAVNDQDIGISNVQGPNSPIVPVALALVKNIFWDIFCEPVPLTKLQPHGDFIASSNILQPSEWPGGVFSAL